MTKTHNPSETNKLCKKCRGICKQHTNVIIVYCPYFCSALGQPEKGTTFVRGTNRLVGENTEDNS